MAQHSNEHLTNTELSAFLDKELTPEELALCDAHLQACQLCQAALADLRLTAALLGGMPQVAVPRSFTLPTNLLPLPETPPTSTKKSPRAHSSSLAPYVWRRAMRTASTLVAILGLFFCLAGVFAIQSHGGASMSTTSNSSSGSAPVAASRDQTTNATASVLAATPSQHSSPNAIATRIVATSTSTQVNPTPTPMSTQQTYENTPSSAPPSSPQVPAALDLGQPGGRLLVGGTLIVLGLLGVIVTHLFERSTHR